MSRHLNDQGVSVIVGTLLLILITVTAAAGLAVMVSQMQKDEMNRQTHLAAVKGENIGISGMSLTNNATLWNSTPLNITNSQNWSSVSFNLMNLNTEDVSVMGIAVNNYYTYPLNFTSLSISTPAGYCNLTSGGGGCQYLTSAQQGTPYLVIPAGGSTRVTMNLTTNLNGDINDTPKIGIDKQIDIKVLTSLTNVFEQTYRLPTAVIVYNTETTTLGSVQRDNIVLDGSQSSSGNATIVSWNWTVMNASRTMTNGQLDPVGNCADVNNLSTVNAPVPPYLNGKIVRFSPSIPGPFCANLTVTDSNGMVATSPYQLIPQNSQFVPAASIKLSANSTPYQFDITVNSTINQGLSDQPVSWVINQYSDSNPFTIKTVYPSSNPFTTDITGTVTVKICGNGTATFSSGKISTNSLSFANNNCSV